MSNVLESENNKCPTNVPTITAKHNHKLYVINTSIIKSPNNTCIVYNVVWSMCDVLKHYNNIQLKTPQHNLNYPK